jgi:hypothetical protein
MSNKMMTNELINMPTTGGPVLENNLFYIERNVDRDLYERLKLNELCYILQSRQTGKTSLLFRICNRLSEDGIKNMRIALTEIDIQDAEKRTWYNDQMDIIKKELKLELDLKKFREDNKSLSPLRTFDKFIQDILLVNIEQNIVIFIDEIDSVLSLPFPTDDYFAFIRNCYEKRANNPEYRRLTFCLVGAASPNDLIADKKRTPFNIGTSITLSPFPTDIDNNNESCKVMKPFLDYVQDMGVLKKILDWTGGHPFLTQKLCNLWVEQNKEIDRIDLDEIINLMIEEWGNDKYQEHFTTIQNRLLFGKGAKAFDRLNLYREILNCEQINCDNSNEQIELRLSGLVLEAQSKLKPYNPIYTEIFNPSWVEQERAKLRLYIEEFDNWKKWEKWKETNNLAYDLQERYLLYGTKCDEVQQWRSNFNGDLSEKEGRFLDLSETFWKKVKDLFSDLRINEDVIESIIQSANDLTGGLSKFNRIVFNIAKDNNVVDLQRDEVQGRLENLVLSNLNPFEEYDQFQKDRDQFLNQEDASIDSFSLISTFKQIAQKEPILFDENNPQHRKLKAMCFIILDQDNKLRILNKIYEELLNQDWIKSVIEQIHPYTKAFREWKDSGKSHDYVLQNNNLKLALKWLGKKPTPKLELLEIEFVMTSLVAEVWATASPFVQSEAISLIITFRPSLQGKKNYSDFLLQAILQWTKSQTLALEKLLEWVNESEIPVKNNREWLESLARSHIRSWNCQKLFDFSLALHSSQKEKDREVFISFDEYLGIKKPQKVIPKETLKKYEKILDKDQESNNNDFQKLVLTFLQRKIARISLMSTQQPEQEKLDVLLDEIVIGSKGHLKSILIFNLKNGLPLYHNKQLKDDDPALYQALFAEGIEGFDSLSEIQEALDSFGDVTKFGNLIYSIFRLKEGTMMVYFFKLTTSFAICFIAPSKTSLGLVVTRSEAKIKDIQKELEDLGF